MLSGDGDASGSKGQLDESYPTSVSGTAVCVREREYWLQSGESGGVVPDAADAIKLIRVDANDNQHWVDDDEPQECFGAEPPQPETYLHSQQPCVNQQPRVNQQPPVSQQAPVNQQPPLSFSQAKCPSCRLTNSANALKAIKYWRQSKHLEGNNIK